MSFASLGMICLGSSVLISNLKILIFSNSFSIISVFFIAGSILFYVLTFVVSSVYNSKADIFNAFEG